MKAKVKYFSALAFVFVLTVAVLPAVILAQNPAPDRGPNEGQGPFNTLVIRGVILIDGTGAPPLARLILSSKETDSFNTWSRHTWSTLVPGQ